MYTFMDTGVLTIMLEMVAGIHKYDKLAPVPRLETSGETVVENLLRYLCSISIKFEVNYVITEADSIP